MPKRETRTFLTGARTALSAFTALSALTTSSALAALSTFAALSIAPATASASETAPLAAGVQVAAARTPRRSLPTGVPAAWSADVEERLQTLREHSRNRRNGRNATGTETRPADSNATPPGGKQRQETDAAQ
jgi:hypothetical protein